MVKLSMLVFARFVPYSNPNFVRWKPPMNRLNREVNEVAEY